MGLVDIIKLLNDFLKENIIPNLKVKVKPHPRLINATKKKKKQRNRSNHNNQLDRLFTLDPILEGLST